MTVYICMFFVLLINGWASKRIVFKVKNNNVGYKTNKVFFIIAWIVISFVEGFRSYSVGTDTQGYVDAFFRTSIDYHRFEVLNRVIIDFLSSFSSNPTIYLLVCSLITNGLILYVIYRYSSNKYYSLFVFVSMMFYFTSYNAVRQAIAYAVVLLAFGFASEKKWIKYCVCMAIAIGFHKSALVGLLYVFIILIDHRRKNSTSNIDSFNRKIATTIILLVVIVFSLRFSDTIVLLATRFFPQYAHYLTGTIGEANMGIRQPIIYSVIFVCFEFLVPSSAKLKRVYVWPLAIATIFGFLHLKYNYMTRFMLYFDITSILSIPYMLNNNIFEFKSKTVFKVIVTAVLIAYMIYSFSCGYMLVTPYRFVWE